MTQPTYCESPPPAHLSLFVHCIWQFRADQETAVQPIIPDGRPELIVHRGTPYREQGQSVGQPPLLFAGQLTQPLRLLAQGPSNVIGVRFLPDGARAFLGESMHHATDRRLDIVALHGAMGMRLVSALRASRDDQASVEDVISYVTDRIDGATPDPVVRSAVEAMLGGGDFSLPAGITLRQFQRRFRSEVGISAKQFRSIRRFRDVFDRVQVDENWTRAALEAGYYDQPQMSRDFRRYLGCTAREWARQSLGLASALSTTAN